jgi:hypothetical protein
MAVWGPNGDRFLNAVMRYLTYLPDLATEISEFLTNTD